MSTLLPQTSSTLSHPGPHTPIQSTPLPTKPTNAGLAAARARGRVGGRPRKLKTNGKVALARRMKARSESLHSRNRFGLGLLSPALGLHRSHPGMRLRPHDGLQDRLERLQQFTLTRGG